LTLYGGLLYVHSRRKTPGAPVASGKSKKTVKSWFGWLTEFLENL
jgi:hypothetical protein